MYMIDISWTLFMHTLYTCSLGSRYRYKHRAQRSVTGREQTQRRREQSRIHALGSTSSTWIKLEMSYLFTPRCSNLKTYKISQSKLISTSKNENSVNVRQNNPRL